MKKLSFNEVASKNTMTPSQMKQIKGGNGTCGFIASFGENTVVVCDISKEDALQGFNYFEGKNWCCDSCGSTSYCG